MQENRDNKPWEGTLYLCHSSEIVCKLLYKKFFRKLDTTVIYGQWKQVLIQQQKQFGLSGSRAGLPDYKEDGSPLLADEEYDGSPVVRTISCPTVSDNKARHSTELPAILTFNAPPPSSPSSPSIASASLSNLPTIYERSQKRSILTSSMAERTKLIATSKHGLITPKELDPIECVVLFYTSSWGISKSEAISLNKIFGASLVPKIHTYIQEKLNGEQLPGYGFVLETGCTPCKYVVCVSVAKDASLLSVDYSYNAFRGALLAIYNYNKKNQDQQIQSILCPALDVLSLPPYNLVHQMAVCYEYWDWHFYGHGNVLPFTHKDEETITKNMRTTSPAVLRLSQDLEQFIKLGLVVNRGLVYDIELRILLNWLTDFGKSKSQKQLIALPTGQQMIKTDLTKATLAQALVDVLKKPDAPPFTLTPMQICVGITGEALESILQLAKENKIKVFDEIDPKQINYGEVLAHGTSGSVSKGTWNDTPVAVKIFFSYQPDLFFNELTMITLVRHNKLVEAIGGYYDKSNAIIVTELLDTNLCQFLQARKDLSPHTKIKIATDIAEAMEFLHSRNIIHRDLKSVNVLLNCGLELVAKVCDFGLSRVADSTSTMTGNIGTVSWIAPEIFENKRYTEKCDVYSFGIILYEIMTQTLPYKEFPTFKIPMVVMKGQRPSIPADAAASLPKEYSELMKLCWHDNPAKRPSFTVILEKLAGMAPPVPAPTRSPLAQGVTAEVSDTSSESSESITSGNFTNTTSDQDNLALEELKAHFKRLRPPLATDELMKRCLKMKRNKVISARTMVRSYLMKEWYQTMNGGKALRISGVRKVLEARLVYILEGYYDLDGNVLMFMDFTNWEKEKVPDPDFVRAFMYIVERAAEKPEAYTKGVTLIMFINNYNMSNLSFRFVSSLFSIIRKCYPLNLKRILAVDPPANFARFLTMFQIFIKTTMKVIEAIPRDRALLYVDPGATPACMGGHLDFGFAFANAFIIYC